MGFVASVCQPSTFRMLIWPEASSAQNNIAAMSADGSTSLGFDPSLELLMQTLDRVRCSRASHLDWSDVEQRVTIAWTPCRFGGEQPFAAADAPAISASEIYDWCYARGAGWCSASR